MARVTYYIYTLLFSLLANCGRSQPYSSDAYPLHRAQQALTHVIIHDIFSPPVASRIYVYAHIAAYEILVKEGKEYKSLRGQVPALPVIAEPSEEISYSLAAVSAFLATGKGLIFSEDMLEDSSKIILRYYKKKVSGKVYESSIRYGSEVAQKILAWSKQDRYTETRAMRRYTLLKADGKWTPTPPVYMAAIEPYWKLIRSLTLDSAAQFKPAPPPLFSKEKESEFYSLAYHVYTTRQNLTKEQITIANFWDCNPFAVNVHGHINYATKKLSPGGHWLSIAGIASQRVQASMMKASAAYTLTAIALFDGFISCWDEKYRSNLIRPETYINAYIDEQWKPLLQTPPFPEYTSGHSVISTAAATVLSAFFGNDFSFIDTSEKEYGYAARNFTSFRQASEEAAISRLYGGIHYRTAIEQGQLQGQKVGECVLQKIKLQHNQ